MKLELSSYLYRGYHANALRSKAGRLRQLLDDRSKASIKKELLEEIAYLEETAQRLDDGDEGAAVNEKEPIRADPRIDIDSVDAPEAKIATNGTSESSP